MATSLPLVPTLMSIPLAQSPTSTDIVSVPTGQNSTQVFWGLRLLRQLLASCSCSAALVMYLLRKDLSFVVVLVIPHTTR